MRPIPKDLLEDILSDPFYRKCCIERCKKTHVQLHHNLIYGGRQVNEKFCILPVCDDHHDQANNKEFRKKLDFIMLSRATEEELERYSKVRNLKAELENFLREMDSKSHG